MKVKIRYPFTVHQEEVRTENQGGQKVVSRQTTSHYSNGPDDPLKEIDLPADAVKIHMHKLEPADAESRKLFEAVYADNQRVANSRGASQDDADFDAKVAAAVAKALAAQKGAK